jgi:pimeloyl-ACP methyl ester carboxylesterase
MAETLVLAPGLNCTLRLFEPQIAALAGGREILVADHGRDDDMAAIARRLLDGAPERFALAGLSMGGYVAFEILRRAPERIAKLALLDTQARADTEEALARRRGLMQLAEKGEFKGVSPRLMPFFIHRDRLGDRELTGTVQAMAESVGREGFLRQQAAIMAGPDSRPDLPAIACPTLVLAGHEDAVTPPERQHEMARAIPDATLVLLPRCGHMAPLERPEAVARQLLLWLSA